MAAAIVERAGMNVKDARGPTKPALKARPGPVPGSVHLWA
jgi:hypothetical protein